MRPCEQCQRPIRVSETRCPFCTKTHRPWPQWMVAAITPIVLGACYGGAPMPCGPNDMEDLDHDGAFVSKQKGPSECSVFGPRECDDHNPTVFEGAPELADGLDNNCEGTIDEGAVASPPPVPTGAPPPGQPAPEGLQPPG